MSIDYTKDPLKFCEGAFKGLTAFFPTDVGDVKVVRAGNTFGISAKFPWLSFANALSSEWVEGLRINANRGRWLDAIYHEANNQYTHAPVGVTLYLPSPSASSASTITASAGVGGGVHEAGHGICDRASMPFPTFKEFESKIVPHLDQSVPYGEANMKKWANVTADMRLEPGMALLYPDTEGRFYSVQDWVFGLEADVRGQGVPSDFMMALRDSGKGWRNENALKVYEEYCEEARLLVETLKPVWKTLKPTHTRWEETAHLPLVVAIQIINKLHDLLKEKLEDGEGRGKGKGEGEPGEGDPSEGKGKGKGDPSEGGEGSADGDSSEVDPSDEKSRVGGKKGIKLEDLEKILKGEGKALDPSSAMQQDVEKNTKNLDHALYVPNGHKPIYRSMFKPSKGGSKR